MRREEFVRSQDSLAFERPSVEIPQRKEIMLKAIGRGKRVLDLGCSGGQISKLIKDQNNEVFGIELNPRAVALAENKGVRVKVFDLNEGIPFEDSFFDVVNAGEVIEHIFDTKYLFEECNRVLKPDGIFLFTAPNLNSLPNRFRVLTGGYLSTMGAYPDDHFGSHIRVFNLSKIRELCRTTGFKLLEVTGIPSRSPDSLRRFLRPVTWVLPQFAELLIIKAQRIDQ